MIDLLGVEVLQKTLPLKGVRRPTPRRGYAGTPGCGPAGEACRTCRHICGFGYKKCALRKATWTRGLGSDIVAKSPACEKWEAKFEAS